jgi:hypothetical protein
MKRNAAKPGNPQITDPLRDRGGGMANQRFNYKTKLSEKYAAFVTF